MTLIGSGSCMCCVIRWARFAVCGFDQATEALHGGTTQQLTLTVAQPSRERSVRRTDVM